MTWILFWLRVALISAYGMFWSVQSSSELSAMVIAFIFYTIGLIYAVYELSEEYA